MKQLIILIMLTSSIVSASDRQETFVPASTQKIIAPIQKVVPIQKATPVQKAVIVQKATPAQKTPTQKAAPMDDLDRKAREKAGKTRRRFCVLALLELRAGRLAGHYERQAERLAERRDARRSSRQK